MKLVLLIVLTVGLTVDGSRFKRSVIDLWEMVSEISGREFSTIFNYGNWCGLPGSGPVLDEFDSCCLMHDYCLDVISKTDCSNDKNVLLVRYKWKIENGTVLCDTSNNDCANSICFCDKIVASCFKIHNSTYDENKIRKL